MFTRFPSWFLVNGSINCLESSKNVRAISCHHPNCSWKQAACKAKKLNTIMTQHAGHIHTRHKRQNAHGQTHSHMHTHTHKHKRRIRMTKHCLQLVFADLAEFYVSSSWVPTAILQTRVAQFSVSRQPRLQFWSFRLRKMMCLTDFAKG